MNKPTFTDLFKIFDRLKHNSNFKMIKTLLFLEETKLNFYSKPLSIQVHGKDSYVLTEGNKLICKLQNSPKQIIQLSEFITFENKEFGHALKRITKSEFLFVTSKFRFFRFEIDQSTQNLKNITEIVFNYAKNFKSNFAINFFDFDEKIYIHISRLIFTFSIKENTFKIFKIFNDIVIELRFESDYFFVLTSTFISKFAHKKDNKSILPQLIFKHEIKNIINFEIFESTILMLDFASKIHIFNQDSKQLESILEINYSSRQSFEITNFMKSEGNFLICYNKNYLVELTKDYKKVQNVFKISQYDFILNGNQVRTFDRKTENMFKVIALKQVKYTNINKAELFYKQEIDTQFYILLSYFSRKYFKRMEINNHIELLKELLEPLCLKKSLLKNPKMKECMVKFFTIVNDFATIKIRSSIDKFIVNKLVVSLKKVESLFDKKDEIFCDLKTFQSSTAASSRNSFDDISHKIIMKSNWKERMDQFNEKEKRIICNNMKRQVLVSEDENENVEINFLRAQNRVVRIQSARHMFMVVLKNKKSSGLDKIMFCFFVFDKFKMKKSLLELFKRVLRLDIQISLCNGNKRLYFLMMKRAEDEKGNECLTI